MEKYCLRKIFIFSFIVLLAASAQVVSAQRAKPVKPVPPKPAPVSNLTLSASEVALKQRYALVIGNNKYPTAPLENPVNDAKALSNSLKSVGFKVTEKYDLTISGMKDAILQFSRQISPGSVGLLFYAGHGVQVNGKNFLLPIDYRSAANQSDFLNTMVDLGSVISSISEKSALTIVILDACRNNPARLSLPFEVEEEGLAAIKQTPGGVYIAYSTSPNTSATDGEEGNSPYSAALARNLLLRPARLEDIFIRTRIEVENLTGQQQIPWENSSLKTLFYFTPDGAAASQSAGRASAGNQPVSKPPLPHGIKSLASF